MDALGDHPHVGEIRHLGLVNAIELVEDRESRKSFPSERRLGYQIYKEALKQGLLLRPLGDVLYFNPPLVISPEEMQEAVSICAGCIRKVLG